MWLLTSQEKSTWASSTKTWSSSLLYNTACQLGFTIKPLCDLMTWIISWNPQMLSALSHRREIRRLGNVGFLVANMELCFRGLPLAEFLIEVMINGFLSQDFSELLLWHKLEPSLFCYHISLDCPDKHIFFSLTMQRNGLTEPIFKFGQWKKAACVVWLSWR